MNSSLPAPASMRRAFAQHARVIHALMLRDLKTRFGATYFGFMIGLLMPLAHIGVVMTVYVVLGRRAPIGTNVPVYLATAIVPFIIWSYTHKQVMQSLSQNRALTHFPIVKLIDILIARAIVELHTSILIVSVVWIAFNIMGEELFIGDVTVFISSLLMSYALGVSTGFVFGLLGLVIPGFFVVGFLIIPLYWISCGVFFIPEGLPELARSAASVFPLFHLVDYGRTGFYAAYLSSYSTPSYALAIIAGNLAIGLAMERFLRPILTTK